MQLKQARLSFSVVVDASFNAMLSYNWKKKEFIRTLSKHVVKHINDIKLTYQPYINKY